MQQKKTFAILLSLAMIVTIVLGNGTFVSAATTEAITGISYYVDSVNGNDDNDGMILSILVDTFISKISFPMQPGPEIGSISDA